MEDEEVDVEVSALAGSLTPEEVPLPFAEPVASPALEDVPPPDDVAEDEESDDDDFDDELPEGDVVVPPLDAGVEESLLPPALGDTDVGTSF